MSDKPVIKDEVREGFLGGLLGDIPSFVRGILATMFGTTICLVAMLQLGGLQVPFTNWLTSQIAPQVKSLDESVTRLSVMVSRIEKLESGAAANEGRLKRLELTTEDVRGRVQRIEKRLGIQ